MNNLKVDLIDQTAILDYFKYIHPQLQTKFSINHHSYCNLYNKPSNNHKYIKDVNLFKKEFNENTYNLFIDYDWNHSTITGEFVLKCLNAINSKCNTINIAIYGLDHKNIKYINNIQK